MARLQDFQTVTPTSSDKLLVVQSQGQGLVSYGDTIGAKMDKTNPTGSGTFTFNGNEVLSGDLTFKGNISLNTLTTLLRGMTTFRIGGGASKTVTVTADGNSNFSFLVVGIGRSADINPILMHIGGYVTASRSVITNITGKTGLTVDNSSTTNMNFVLTNTVSNVSLDVRLIPLFDNSFTVT